MFLTRALGDYARRMSRVVAFSVTGVVFLLIGLVFLTLAFWLMLARWGDAIFASQVIGALYVASGMIFLAIASAYKRRRYRYRQRGLAGPPRDPVTQIIEGFLVGLDAGRRSSRTKPR